MDACIHGIYEEKNKIKKEDNRKEKIII